MTANNVCWRLICLVFLVKYTKIAQHDIDLRPELYTHYYKEEFPERFHSIMDLRYFGPGERIVFEEYSKRMYDESRLWVGERDIFPDGDIGNLDYTEAKYNAR